jgi:hypothetical protein
VGLVCDFRFQGFPKCVKVHVVRWLKFLKGVKCGILGLVLAMCNLVENKGSGLAMSYSPSRFREGVKMWVSYA